MSDGILLSSKDAWRLQNMLRWFEHGRDRQIPRRRGGVSGGTNIKIFKVHENDTGDGVYKCYEQVIVDADWDLTNGAAKIWDKDETPVAVKVLNLAEWNPSAGQHNLAINDVLIACWTVDDEGKGRWVGVPAVGIGEIHRAFCKGDAPGDTKITCYLDTDETGTQIEVHCSISGGGNLNQADPHLVDGLEISVRNDNGTWKPAGQIFQHRGC
ncbi:MAG: hypothetical protein ABSG99_02655 [Sedimentisphaerales bacterium]